jgi:hypothetical protein
VVGVRFRVRGDVQGTIVNVRIQRQRGSCGDLQQRIREELRSKGLELGVGVRSRG